MARLLKYTLMLGAFALLAAIPLAKQFSPLEGSIDGSVTDDHGPILNASIEVRHLVGGAVIVVDSGAGGEYSVNNLRPGMYSLWVEAHGHDSLWVPQIVVEAGQTTRRDIHLERLQNRPAAGL